MSANFVPLGEIMDVRRVYTVAAKVRRTLNHQPQREPASADELLAWPKLDGQPETNPEMTPGRAHGEL
jgi:hypothetical protein